MNMYASDNPGLNDLAGFFQVLGQPARLQLVAALAAGEACVCHLEVLSGQRQAYISQQLGVLRRAGLVRQRREGKHVYYALASPQVIDLVQSAAGLTGLQMPFPAHHLDLPVPGCSCPVCAGAAVPGVSVLQFSDRQV